MGRVNNLQMSLFGNFINIKPKTEIVIQLLTALQNEQFFPGSADIATVDIKTGKVTVDSRMQLVSPDKTWVIVFLDERIDFNYTYQDGTAIYKSVEQVIKIGENLIEKVFAVFANTTGNRLAVNGKYVLEDLSDVELKGFMDKFTNPLSVFGDDAYAEWTVRYNSKAEMMIDQNSEVCNRIIDISQYERREIFNSTEKCSYDMVISFDVNTAQFNGENRFKYTDLLKFAENSSEFMVSAFKEIEG